MNALRRVVTLGVIAFFIGWVVGVHKLLSSLTKNAVSEESTREVVLDYLVVDAAQVREPNRLGMARDREKSVLFKFHSPIDSDPDILAGLLSNCGKGVLHGEHVAQDKSRVAFDSKTVDLDVAVGYSSHKSSPLRSGPGATNTGETLAEIVAETADAPSTGIGAAGASTGAPADPSSTRVRKAVR